MSFPALAPHASPLSQSLLVLGCCCLAQAAKVGIFSSRSDPVTWTYEQKKAGDGFGRPLYQFNTVELPEDRSGRHCISIRMDKYTHALTVDEKVQDVNTVAWTCYHDQVDNLGTGNLEVSTTDDLDVPLSVRAYGAGIIEGLLTARRINEFHSNVMSLLQIDAGTGDGMAVVEQAVRMSLVAWEAFTGGDAQDEPLDDLPRQAWAALIQLRGIRDGVNFFATSADPAAAGISPLTAYEIMLINMHAELPALIDLYSRSQAAKAQGHDLTAKSMLAQIARRKGFLQRSTAHERRMKAKQWARWAAHEAHGSAVVRRLGSLGAPEDMLVGHVSFGDYGEMLRIMKVYRLNFNTLVPGVSMSSYPGCVGSTDDYLVTHLGLVAMSTSLFLPEEGEFSKPPRSNDGLPAFLRAIIASRLATQPRMWSRVYGYTPGMAGSKQWLLVDFSKFKVGQKLANDTVWMVESLPRTQHGHDVTHLLEANGFIEAHGVAHFKTTREIYGEPEQAPSSYEEHVASSLVDKGATIRNLATLRQVLTESKSSRGASQIPIAPRHDLDPTDPIPAGAIDAKTTSRCLVKKHGFQVRSGPPMTDSKQNFSFVANNAPTFPGWPSTGLPNTWSFAWSNILPGQDPKPLDPKEEDCNPEGTSTQNAVR